MEPGAIDCAGCRTHYIRPAATLGWAGHFICQLRWPVKLVRVGDIFRPVEAQSLRLPA